MTVLFLINVLLALAWVAVTGAFDFINLAFGFLLGAGAIYLIRAEVGATGYLKRAKNILSLALLFIYELILSALRVARLALRLDLDLKPAIIAYPLRVDRDFEITMLANLITLTPGTLSVDVSADRKTLYVHCIDIDDEQAVIDDIRNGFESKILEAFR